MARISAAAGPANVHQSTEDFDCHDRLLYRRYRLIQWQYLFAGINEEFAMGTFYSFGWNLHSSRMVFADLVTLVASRKSIPPRREPERP